MGCIPLNGKKDNNKPFSDPRWRKWPGKGIKKFGKPNPQVKKAIDEYFKQRNKDKR